MNQNKTLTEKIKHLFTYKSWDYNQSPRTINMQMWYFIIKLFITSNKNIIGERGSDDIFIFLCIFICLKDKRLPK